MWQDCTLYHEILCEATVLNFSSIHSDFVKDWENSKTRGVFCKPVRKKTQNNEPELSVPHSDTLCVKWAPASQPSTSVLIAPPLFL